MVSAKRPRKSAGKARDTRVARHEMRARIVLPEAALFSRDQVVEIQRARIVAAMVQVACERGVANASVAHVVERAGVSRRTFYELFSDREECFLAAFDDAIERIAARVVPACQSEGRWHERVRTALVELLAFCEQQPSLARIALVESLSGGPVVLARRSQIQARLVAEIHEGRREAQKDAKLSPLIAEGVVGGVLAVLTNRLTTSDGAPKLLDLTGPLMSMIVLPYLGAAAARREAARPTPAPATNERSERNGGIDLHDMGMRLTYRTLRVLMAVAEHPGGSNRLVGETAGITDQGQISKLLGRLKRVGLVVNTGAEAGKGMPNAWTLTDKGRRVTEGVRAHTCEEPQQ